MARISTPTSIGAFSSPDGHRIDMDQNVTYTKDIQDVYWLIDHPDVKVDFEDGIEEKVGKKLKKEADEKRDKQTETPLPTALETAKSADPSKPITDEDTLRRVIQEELARVGLSRSEAEPKMAKVVTDAGHDKEQADAAKAKKDDEAKHPLPHPSGSQSPEPLTPEKKEAAQKAEDAKQKTKAPDAPGKPEHRSATTADVKSGVDTDEV